MYLVKLGHAYLLLLQSHWEEGLLQQFIVFQVLHTLDTQVVPRNTTQVLLVAPHQLKVRHTKLILLFTFIIIMLILLYRSPVSMFQLTTNLSKSCIRHTNYEKKLISIRLFPDRKTTSLFYYNCMARSALSEKNQTLNQPIGQFIRRINK